MVFPPPLSLSHTHTHTHRIQDNQDKIYLATAKTKAYLQEEKTKQKCPDIYGYLQDKKISTYIWLQPRQKRIYIYMATAKTKKYRHIYGYSQDKKSRCREFTSVKSDVIGTRLLDEKRLGSLSPEWDVRSGVSFLPNSKQYPLSFV